MKVIVISSNRLDEKEADCINEMFENGLMSFHLRKPKLSTVELANYIKQIKPQFHKNIVIHSHHILAGKFNLGGIHFTKAHLRKTYKTWYRLKLLNFKRPLKSMILSASHSKLATLYDQEPYEYNYLFLSPIFDSLTGKYQSGFYEEGLRAVNAKSGKKIIARGGIDASKVEKVKELGFYGMSLYSALWEKEKPLEEYLKVIRHCNEAGIEVD
ncbi:MAG: thiamine phosphate synthase [Bacteroidia bacterium]|nr:thiamine phosphate synthase [Bacteroidia bacterium]